MDTIAFYIVAHADDWQLFMYPHSYECLLQKNSRAVLIFTTAGDAGKGSEFWHGREEAAKSSIIFCNNAKEKIIVSSGMRQFNRHKISFWEANNNCCYFLRLPDGGLDGGGFGNNSLSMFKSGQITSLSALDKSTVYNGWSDLVTTLKRIITKEAAGFNNASIHYLNPDTEHNPNDHPDHIATGLAVNEVELKGSMKRFLYRGYSSGLLGKRLKSKDKVLKKEIFAAYDKRLKDLCNYETLQEDPEQYYKWLTAHSVCMEWEVCARDWKQLEDDWLKHG